MKIKIDWKVPAVGGCNFKNHGNAMMREPCGYRGKLSQQRTETVQRARRITGVFLGAGMKEGRRG